MGLYSICIVPFWCFCRKYIGMGRKFGTIAYYDYEIETKKKVKEVVYDESNIDKWKS